MIHHYQLKPALVLALVSCHILLMGQTSLDDLQRSGWNYYKNGNYDSAIFMFNKGYQQSQNAHDRSGTIDFLYGLGASYYYSSDLLRSDSLLSEALRLNMEHNSEDSLFTAQLKHQLASTKNALLKFDESQKLAEQALATRIQLLGDLDTLVAASYNLMATNLRTLGKYDEARKYSNYAMDIWIANPKVSNLDKSNTCYGLGWLSIAFGDMNEAISYLQKSLAIRKSLLPWDHVQISNCHHLLAWTYRDLSKYGLALQNAEQSLKIMINRYGKEHGELAKIYSFMASLLGSIGNNKLALDYQRVAIDLWVKNYGHEAFQLIQGYKSMAFIYQRLKMPEPLLEYARKALQVTEANVDANHAEFISLYRLFARYHQLIGDQKKELESLQQAHKVAKINFGNDHYFTRSVDYDIADLYLRTGSYKQSKQLYEATLDRTLLEDGIYHKRYVVGLEGLGDILQQQDLPDLALQYYHMGLLCLASDTTKSDDLEFQPETLSLGSQTMATRLSYKKGLAWVALQKQNPDSTILIDKAIDAFAAGINYAESLRDTYTDEDSKIDHYESMRNLYAAKIESCVRRFEETGDKYYAEEALRTSENSKAFALRQALNSHAALNFAGIPDELIELEKQLRSDLVDLGEKIYELRSKNDTDKSGKLERTKLETKIRLDSLEKHMEVHYPKYFDLKYRRSDLSFAGEQRTIQKDELLLEYFIDKKSIYRFDVTSDSYKINKFEKPINFDQLISSHRKSISDFVFISDSARLADSLYAATSSELFNLLLANLSFETKDSVQNLTIVPDGLLGLINFETLLINAPNAGSSINYKSLDYLLHYANIKIVPSITVLHQTKRNRNIDKLQDRAMYAGFAPSYENISFDPVDSLEQYISGIRQNQAISGNKDEILKVADIFNGRSYLDSAATEKQFKQIVKDYRLLHLAMHGIVNERDQKAMLVFGSDFSQEEDGRLNIEEIYNLEVEADMVILSACNTGYGEVVNGEGVISLSRAFMYAGCPSVITSLWALPDQVAPQIISAFAENLISELPTDQSLRRAKLDYISKTEEHFNAHPYYWAGLVPMGEMSVIESNREHVFMFFLVVLLVFVVFILRTRIGKLTKL